MSPVRNIIWIASYPKSGNTWFRIFLTNLLSSSIEAVNINELDKTMLASDRSIFDRIMGVNSSDLKDEEIRILRPHFYRFLSSDTENVIYIKVHDAWERNNKQVPLFPKEITKGVIYIIRHPLDVAVSFAYHRGISFEQSLAQLDDETNALCKKNDRLFNQFTQRLYSWSKHVTSWIDNSTLPIYVIKYEDLLTNALAEFKNAIEFLELEYSISEVERAVLNSRFELLKKQETKGGFREKPINLSSFFRSGSTGNWKDHYSQDQIKSFVGKNHELLDRFSYNFDF